MEDSLSPEQITALDWANGVVSVLSLIGEIFMIATYAYVPTLKTFAMKLIISLIVSDVIYSISTLMSLWYNTPLCIIQGFLGQIGVMSGVVWFASISYVSYLQFTKFSRDINKKYDKMLCIALTVSIFSALL